MHAFILKITKIHIDRTNNSCEHSCKFIPICGESKEEALRNHLATLACARLFTDTTDTQRLLDAVEECHGKFKYTEVVASIHDECELEFK